MAQVCPDTECQTGCRIQELKSEKQRHDMEESALRDELVTLTNQYEGGLDRSTAQSLRDQLVDAEVKRDEQTAEIQRQGNTSLRYDQCEMSLYVVGTRKLLRLEQPTRRPSKGSAWKINNY